MKNNFFKSLICFVAAFTLLFGTYNVSAAQNNAAVNAQGIIDGIIACKLKETGCVSVQQYIDSYLSKKPDSDEWYALTLCQYGNYNFTAYQKALINYLNENRVSSASSRQKYALILIGTGSGDKFIYNTLCDSIGRQGVISWIFGLHILNNGYVSREYSASAVKEKLISLQHADGGWSVMGSYGDVDTTAMAITCLAPYYKDETNVKASVNKALSFLSSRQEANGGFQSYGVNNAESAAQVLTALSSLGIDFNDGRFVKNGNTVLDAIVSFRLDDGGFCHKLGGGYNGLATVQVFYSLVSYIRMCNGKTGLYIFDKRNPGILEIPQSSETPAADVPKSVDVTGGTQSAKSQNSSRPSGEKPQNTTVSSTAEKANGQSAGALQAVPDKQHDSVKSVPSQNKQKYSYKYFAVAVIVFALLVFCAVLVLKKNKNIKNYALGFFVAAGAVIIVLCLNIQSTESFYSSHTGKEKTAGTVTISVRCDTIKDRGAQHIPNDAVILKTTKVNFEKGDTVYDILLSAAAENKIQLESAGSEESAYIKGIANIYEFDFGDLSGWMYFVNGESPSVSCGEYKVKNGDSIEWLYTCNLGKDIKSN